MTPYFLPFIIIFGYRLSSSSPSPGVYRFTSVTSEEVKWYPEVHLSFAFMKNCYWNMKCGFVFFTSYLFCWYFVNVFLRFSIDFLVCFYFISVDNFLCTWFAFGCVPGFLSNELDLMVSYVCSTVRVVVFCLKSLKSDKSFRKL